MRAACVYLLDRMQGVAIGLLSLASRSCILENILWPRRAEGSMQAHKVLKNALSSQWLS